MEEKTINIMDLLLLAWRYIWVIALSAVIIAVGAFSYCKFLLTEVYSATASIIATNGAVTVHSDKTTVSASDLSASLYLAETVIDILKTPDIYKDLADALNKDANIASDAPNAYKFQNLMGRARVARRGEDTLFIDVTFSSTDPVEAMRIANKFVEISCEYIPEYIPHSIAKVASTAIKAGKTYPRTFRTTAIAGVIGAVLAYVVVFIIDSTNKAIKGEEDFVNRFDVPLLGAVPNFENVENSAYRKSKGRGGYGSGY